ncbi:MAG: hypothetical protein ACRENE_05790 [Polyangiaceae bacterium]
MRLRVALDQSLPGWRFELEALGQVRLIRARAAGWKPTDETAMRGLFLAYLSAMTDWRRIQSALPQIDTLFDDWTPPSIARLRDRDLAKTYTWLLDRKLGSVLLRRQLECLRAAARVFMRMGRDGATVCAVLERHAQADVASVLSAKESPWKLPGVGIALAAEFLKNLGFDDFKPDRHTIRILGPGRLGLVDTLEPGAVRLAGLRLARDAGLLAAELDQMLWMYCAQGYARVCSANPDCSACPLSSRCNFPSRGSPRRNPARHVNP